MAAIPPTEKTRVTHFRPKKNRAVENESLSTRPWTAVNSTNKKAKTNLKKWNKNKNQSFVHAECMGCFSVHIAMRWDYCRRIIFGISMETRQLPLIRRSDHKTRAEFGRGELSFFSRWFRSVRRTRAMRDPRLQTDCQIKNSEAELYSWFQSESESTSESHIFVLRPWLLIRWSNLRNCGILWHHSH